MKEKYKKQLKKIGIELIIIVISVITAILLRQTITKINLKNFIGCSGGGQAIMDEKTIYHAKIKPYLGERIKGSEVKSMIDNIISMNREGEGEQGKFIGITVGNITNYSTDDSLNNVASVCQKASEYPMPKEDGTEENPLSDADNTEDNVEATIKEMAKLKTKINSQKSYTVTATQVGEIYTWINITEEEQSTN